MPSAATESVFSLPLNHFRCAGVESLGCSEESAEQVNLPTGLNRFVGDRPNQLLKVFHQGHKAFDKPSKTSVWTSDTVWPLVLFGPSGAGKTSLGLSFLSDLNGLSTANVEHQSTEQKPGYISASDFDRRFRSAMETDSVVEFRSTLASRSGLLIDNLHELASKPVAQHEMVQLIDEMVAKNRPILFTMTDSPFESTQLIPQLASRLGSGLSLPVSPPGPDARFEIIRDLAELHRLRFTPQAMLILVEKLPVTVPGINHFLLQFKLSLAESDRSHNTPIIEADQVSQWLDTDDSATVEIEKLIRKAVAKTFNVTVADLASQSRKQTTVLARGVAIWLNRQLTQTSFKKIGQQFGNRDHSTIMHSWRKIDCLVNKNQTNSDTVLATQKTIRKLEQTLTQQITTQLSAHGKPVD
jgi:chromosomal replication initiator protein